MGLIRSELSLTVTHLMWNSRIFSFMNPEQIWALSFIGFLVLIQNNLVFTILFYFFHRFISFRDNKSVSPMFLPLLSSSIIQPSTWRPVQTVVHLSFSFILPYFHLSSISICFSICSSTHLRVSFTHRSVFLKFILSFFTVCLPFSSLSMSPPLILPCLPLISCTCPSICLPVHSSIHQLKRSTVV